MKHYIAVKIPPPARCARFDADANDKDAMNAQAKEMIKKLAYTLTRTPDNEVQHVSAIFELCKSSSAI